MGLELEFQRGLSDVKVLLFPPHAPRRSLINNSFLMVLEDLTSCGSFPTNIPAGSALGFVVPPEPFVRQDMRYEALTYQPGLSTWGRASWLPVHDLAQLL